MECVRAHARAIWASQKNKYSKNRQKSVKIGQKKLSTFFSKFHRLFHLYVNHTIFFCNIYTTPKYGKMKFEEICNCAENYIWKLKKKNRKKPHFFATWFFKIGYSGRIVARARSMFVDDPKYVYVFPKKI